MSDDRIESRRAASDLTELDRVTTAAQHHDTNGYGTYTREEIKDLM